MVARSASSRMIAADLPPSSSVQRFSCSPHSAAICLPATVRPGERDLVDVGVGDEVLADLAAGLHDVEHARRQPGLLQRLGQEVRVERRLRRRLEHDGRARRERRRQLQHGDEQRHVPRHDGADDADRLAAHERRAQHARRGAPRTRTPGRARCSSRAPWWRRRPGPSPRTRSASPSPRRWCGRSPRSGACRMPESVAMMSARSAGDICGHGPGSNASRAAATARSTSAVRRVGHLGDDLLGRRRDHREGVGPGRVDPVAADEELVSVQFLLLLRAPTSGRTVAPFRRSIPRRRPPSGHGAHLLVEGSIPRVPPSGHGSAASRHRLNSGTAPATTVPSRPTGSDPEVSSWSVSPSGSTRAANRSPRVPVPITAPRSGVPSRA